MTYDPILESRPVPRVRVLSPLRPPRPGTALVLVRYRGEAVAVPHGQPIPEARWSAYRWAYLVDVADHRLVLETPLLSRDPNVAFRGRVSLTCRVIDPVEVITRGIRDMGAALREHVQRMLRRVSGDYDIGQFHQAEDALNDRARTCTGDSAVRLREIDVELLVETRPRTLLTGNPIESLVAEIVEREGPRAALAWIDEAESAEREQLLRALRVVLDRNPDHEPFGRAPSGSGPPRTSQPPPGPDRTRPRSGRVRGVPPDAGHQDR
ncbi:MAG: hypothetical protein ACJ73S_26395 [Mycobacteriales bacterium]